MNKKLIQIGLIGAVVLLGLVVTLHYTGVLGQVGFGTLSLQSVDYSTDGQVFHKEFLLYIVGDGSGQSASVHRNQLNSNQGIKSQKPFTLTYKLLEQTCDYRFQKQDPVIYRISVVDAGRTFTENGCKNKMNDYVGGFWYQWSGAFLPAHCYIYKYTTDGVHGSIYPTKKSFKSEFTLSNGEQSYSGQVTEQARDLDLGGIARINYRGGLTQPNVCPQPETAGLTGVWLQSKNKWLITSKLKDGLQAYINLGDVRPAYSTSGDFYTCVAKSTKEGFSPQKCVDLWNGRVDSLYNWESNHNYLSTLRVLGEKERSGTEDSGTLKLDVSNQPVEYPTFTVRLDADWVGIIAPEGKPVIVDKSCSGMSTGSTGVISIDVKNAGDGEGHFRASITCDNELTPITTSQIITVLPQEIGTLQIGVTGQATEEITKSCRITVNDVNAPANSDSTSVNCVIKPVVYCNEGTLRCGYLSIEKCVNNKWTAITDCSNGCTQKTGTPQCITNNGGQNPPPVPPTTQCKWWDIPCQMHQLMQGLKSAMMWFGVIMVGLISIIIVIKVVLWRR